MGKPQVIVSYAHSNPSRKKIIKLARQYDGIDMAKLMGADEDNLPFVVLGDEVLAGSIREKLGEEESLRRSHGEGDFTQVCFWNAYNGIMNLLDEDPVRRYATIKFLQAVGYPTFGNISEAEEYARQNNWPRKTR